MLWINKSVQSAADHASGLQLICERARAILGKVSNLICAGTIKSACATNFINSSGRAWLEVRVLYYTGHDSYESTGTFIHIEKRMERLDGSHYS